MSEGSSEVIVGNSTDQSAIGTGTLLFSGSISAIRGDALTTGRWRILNGGVLDFKGTTIKRLGNLAVGKSAVVDIEPGYLA